jgi:hypothetical protein
MPTTTITLTNSYQCALSTTDDGANNLAIKDKIHIVQKKHTHVTRQKQILLE